LFASVVYPTTISLSFTINVSAFKYAVVPPILRFPFTYRLFPTVKSPEDAVILAEGTVPDDRFEAFNEVKFAPDPLNNEAVITPEEFTEETVMFGEPVRFCAIVEIPAVVA